MLEIRNLTVKDRLFGVNATFYPRHKHAVIGVNGAGKSTLLNAISGQVTYKHYDGSIRINGCELLKFNAKKRAKRLAILSQSTVVSFDYDTRDVILMGLYPHKVGVMRQEMMLKEVCELLSLTKQTSLRFHTLSGGQQQRVHLARVILQIIADKDMMTEKWLLLDEHVAGLDLYQQAKIFDVLDSLLKRYNLGIIMVIHDLNFVTKFCDNILLMDGGRLIESGNPKQVILNDKFKKVFKVQPKYLPEENAFLFKPI